MPEGEFGAREDGVADLAGSNAAAQGSGALLEAEYLGDAEQQVVFSSGFDHVAAFDGIHGHGLFAEHRLAAAESQQHVMMMERVGRGDEDGVDFGGTAEI